MLYNSLILDFCKNNKNWKEILTSEPYHLKIKSDGDYYIFNYNQILSDFSLDICKEARGLIIDCDLNRVVCRSFNKFFNYGEKYAAEIDWPTARIQEKLDGCFSGEDCVLLADGSKRKIKDIVKNREEIEVLSYNFKTKSVEPKKVIGWNKSKKTYKLDNWLTIYLSGVSQKLDGQIPQHNIITPTKNHVIFKKDNNNIIEVPADQLKNGDIVYTPVYDMYELEKQIVLGGLLGDGSCTYPHNKTSKKGFHCRHSLKQKDYVDYKASFFKSSHKTRGYADENSYGKNKYELTVSCQDGISNIWNICYNNNGNKEITMEWLEQLNWLGFSVWYMDDGSLSKGSKNNSIHLHTEGYSEKEVDIIVDFYNKKQLKCYKCNYRKYFMINFSTDASEEIWKNIREYICPSMQYKLPDRHKGYFNYNIKNDIKNQTRQIVLKEGYIIKIEDGLKTHNYYKAKEVHKYDIEVEDNNNYFCQGILVHNSLIRLWFDCLNEDPCWTISTSGTIDAFDAELPNGGSFGCLFTRTFANMFRSHSEMDRMFSNLNPFCTYVFELTTLDNRVVIRYPEPLVHHLSTFNNITGEELWDEDVFWEDDEGNIKTFLRPNRYYFINKSLWDTLNMVKKLDSTHEGVVVADSKGNRIKIKTEEYVTMHRTVGGRAFTLEQAVDIIKLGKEDDLYMYPECVEKIEQVKEAIKYEINFLLNVLAWFRSHKYFELGRKEFARAVSDFNMPNKSFERYVFMCYDGKFAIDKTDDFVYNDIMKKTSNNILKMLGLK